MNRHLDSMKKVLSLDTAQQIIELTRGFDGVAGIGSLHWFRA